ncbi:MAG TPA: hypothetical protein DCQ04_05555 [Actinobacteria bacterium]|nr:hypothetical protein [Actinomycetota bacterium]
MKERELIISSEHLHNSRHMWILTPDDGRVPEGLLVFLDGEFYRDRVGAVQIVRALCESGGIPPSIVAFISYESPDARWVECPCYPPFVRFVADEVLARLDAEIPGCLTLQNRVLAGLSYTGLAAAYIALVAPDRFTKIIAQSGSFWSNDCWLIDQYRSAKRRLPAEFYLDVGVRETQENVTHKEDVIQVLSQIDGVRRFRDVLSEVGHDPVYVEFDGDHEFEAWAKTLPSALRWAFSERQPNQPPLPTPGECPPSNHSQLPGAAGL